MPRIQAIPEPLDLDLYSGDDFAITLVFNEPYYDSQGQRQNRAYDITGWIFAAVWKPNQADPRSIVWDVTERTDLTGTVVLKVTSAMFDSMKAISPSGVWDLQVTFPDSSHQTMLAGYVYTSMDVTP